MAKEKVTVVTDKDVAEAEAALKQGRQALEDAREAYFNEVGSWDDVKSQEAVIEFAEARLIQLGRSRDKYKASARLEALEQVRAEIDAESLSAGDDLVSVVANAEDALRAVAKAFRDRNEKIDGWRQSAENHDVGTMRGRVVPSPDDAGIALVDGPGGGLRVGNRLLTKHFPGRILEGLLFSLPNDESEVPYFRDVVNDGLV